MFLVWVGSTGVREVGIWIADFYQQMPGFSAYTKTNTEVKSVRCVGMGCGVTEEFRRK